MSCLRLHALLEWAAWNLTLRSLLCFAEQSLDLVGDRSINRAGAAAMLHDQHWLDIPMLVRPVMCVENVVVPLEERDDLSCCHELAVLVRDDRNKPAVFIRPEWSAH